MKRPSIPNLRISSLPLLLFSFPTLVLSNTEKTIFLGPETVRVPSQQPTLSDLHLEVLTPQAHDNKWSLRTALPRQFPNSTHPHGPATWLLLDNLTQGQRYELRVCWAATVSPICLNIFFICLAPFSLIPLPTQPSSYRMASPLSYSDLFCRVPNSITIAKTNQLIQKSNRPHSK